MSSRSAYFGAKIGETRLAAGAHVCGLLFSTDEELYVVTVNAQVASGPREFAVIDGSGKEVVPVTGSTAVKPDINDVAVFVRAPNMRLYINGEQVAKGKVQGKQFTSFGVTYGASSSGQCSFDDIEVWRPPPAPTTAEFDDAAQTELQDVLSGQQAHLADQGAFTDVAEDLQQYEPSAVINTSSPDDEGVFVEVTDGSDQATVCAQQLSGSGTYFAMFATAGADAGTYFATSAAVIECPATAATPESSDTVAWSADDFPDLPDLT
jgi:hypothetical protein